MRLYTTARKPRRDIANSIPHLNGRLKHGRILPPCHPAPFVTPQTPETPPNRVTKAPSVRNAQTAREDQVWYMVKDTWSKRPHGVPEKINARNAARLIANRTEHRHPRRHARRWSNGKGRQSNRAGVTTWSGISESCIKSPRPKRRHRRKRAMVHDVGELFWYDVHAAVRQPQLIVRVGHLHGTCFSHISLSSSSTGTHA